MLEELRISSLGVIDDATLEFGPGLNVLTGETGAGKTMVVTALGLLLGARADPAAVRQGAPRTRVEGRLSLDDEDLIARAEDAGAVLDDGVLILGRTVSSEGRSRATAGGAAVPASVLGSLSGERVVVHGQADQQRLLLASRQRDCLDAFGGPAVGGGAHRLPVDVRAAPPGPPVAARGRLAGARTCPRGRPAAARPGRDRGRTAGPR